ncbi:MAG: hypothetical protein KDD36_04335 [Flavobacteriales bacterium]|nr:hypothetical protein [Flavobacteriales bacterium]
MNKLLISALSVAFVCGMTARSTAQNKDLETVKFKVSTNFRPTVVEAVKRNDLPQIPDTTIPAPPMKVEVIKKQMQTGFTPEPIAAAKFKGEKLPRLYRGYARGGIGNYATPYAEIYLNSLRSRKGALGAHLKHLSSATTLKDAGYSGWSENGVTLYGKKFSRKASWESSLDMQSKAVHYYGFNASDSLIPYYDIPIEKEDLRQRFLGLQFDLGVQNQQVDTGKMRLHSHVSVRRYMDLIGVAENRIKFNAGMARAFNTEFLNIDLNTYYYGQALYVDTASAVILNLNPRISTRKERLFFTIGAQLFLESDSTREKNFYPDMQLGYHLVRNVVTAYMKGYGDVRRNDLAQLAGENPWIATDNLDFRLMNKRELGVTGGLRGSLSRNTTYTVSYTLFNVKNVALFVNDPTMVLRNKFLPVYDDMTSGRAHGGFTWDDQNRFRLSLNGEYNTYQMDSVSEAWHLPQLKAGGTFRYNFRNKLLTTLNAHYVGQRKYLAGYDDAGKEVSGNLPGYLDMGLELEYRYSKILSAWIKSYNLLGKRYMIWNQYPSQRLQVMLGFSYSFWGQ